MHAHLAHHPTSSSRLTPPFALAAFVLAALAACGPLETASFDVRESVEQLHVTHAHPGWTLRVLDADTGQEVARGEADALGSLVFRRLLPGDYVVVTEGVVPEEHTGRLHVMSVEESLPDPSFYEAQVLEPGFGYITTRDGTKLSVFVSLPGPVEEGPYPTLINYSGYSPSRPGRPLDASLSGLCDDYPVLCNAPDFASGIIGGLTGFATVGVNMRGTGCSGGAYDFFETLQRLDGYDVIEVVARQPWVLGHRVGMVGLSYPGISQLFVAAEQPPSLAAIAPLSVIGSTMSTLRPGGILNDGFALTWAERVLAGADPYGRGWERERVEAGDLTCAENQLLHGQKVDTVQVAIDHPFYEPEIVDPINPENFVGQITVPVFFASAWQDEQTGPGFHTLLDRFESAPFTRFTVYNGVHPDGYAPFILTEWKTFLDFYVRRELVPVDPLLEGITPVLTQEIFGVGVSLPESRYAGRTDFEQARAEWEAEPRYRVAFESGGRADAVGAPVPVFEWHFDRWPPSAESYERWFFQPDGSLAPTEPTGEGASVFRPDPTEGDRGILAPGADIWDPVPAWAWMDDGPGHAVHFLSAPLARDRVMVGPGSADLWLKSTATEADLEVTVTEVRPDGKEVYVQSGWLRASRRALAPDSTELFPRHTHRREDVAPLTPGEWVRVRVPIEAFAHVFRAGSRIRIVIDTPGGSRAEWRFALAELGPGAEHTIGHGKSRPSSVVLPFVEGVSVPADPPACPGLRGQMCRDFVAWANEAAP